MGRWSRAGGGAPAEARVVRNLSLDLVGALGVGVTLAFVTTLLPTIARRGGIDPIGIAAIVAMPFVANMLSGLAGRWGPRSSAQLAWIRGAGAVALLGLLVTPLPLPPLLVAVMFAYWLSLSLSSPFQLRLWGALYPGQLVGRVIGLLGMGRAAAAGVAAFACGVIADRFGVPAAVGVTAVIGAAAAMAYAGQRATVDEPVPPFSARDSLRALRERPILRRLALAQGLYGGGLIAAMPLFALVHVDRLHLSLVDVGFLGILLSAATVLAYPLAGILADWFGPLIPLRLGGLFGIAALLGYALGPSVFVLWLASVALGVANASADLGINSTITAETPMATRAAALAGWNTVTGARAIVATFTMSLALSVGAVTVAAGLLVCAVVSTLGVVIFFRPLPLPRSASDHFARSSPVVTTATSGAPGG